EIEYTGSANEQIFDTTDPEKAKEIGIETKVKPIIISVGNDMVVKGFDQELIGKETEKSYSIHLTPENAFGKRNPKLIQMIPLKVFKEHKTQAPLPGTMFQFDGKIGKVLTASGGRVIVDFNNPLAGREVEYKIKVLRKIDDIDEKIKSLNEFFFRKNFEFKIEDKTLKLKVDKGFKQFVDLFKDKFKEILDLELEVEEIGEKTDKKSQ
ncbi:MAG: FKBP-type peptidyl-prolyl cis-trans isomerase, partial [Nanoarchaeota archaeon]|nr:FKBP-type peptidyl-prolyl cis-trans isomerase [Nanoarchaeota archaeon]